mmetsp:Transcript_18992/g.44233  ORF Transcript_18992/g.44233 Transcript_18992/m.44233 type:complete len:198 (-) Transcript_18992:448-1041(-)
MIDQSATTKDRYNLLQTEECSSSCFDPKITLSNKAERKSVRINDVVHLHWILHASDMNAMEVTNTWYQKNDIRMMKLDVSRTIQKILSGAREGDDDDDDSPCFRGLEFASGSGAQWKKFHMNRARRVVLREQDDQWCRGVYDPEALRSVYIEANDPCKKAAQALAQADQMKAMKIHLNSSELNRESNDLREVEKHSD